MNSPFEGLCIHNVLSYISIYILNVYYLLLCICFLYCNIPNDQCTVSTSENNTNKYMNLIIMIRNKNMVFANDINVNVHQKAI